MILRPFEYIECHRVEDALAALAQYGDDGRLIAGGTVLVPLMKHQVLRPTALISLAGIPGMDEIAAESGGVRIGPLATHRAVSRSALVQSAGPLLATACGRVASPVIRSMGTLGGNLCYGESASDPSPALLALGARLHLQGPGGRRTMLIEKFFLGFFETALADNEVLVEIEVPAMPAGARWTYFKWTPRAREDKPLIGLAAILELVGRYCRRARLGLGGVAARPALLAAAAAELSGRELTDPVIARAATAAAEEVDPIDDLQASAGYRRQMVEVWVRRQLHRLVQDGGAA